MSTPGVVNTHDSCNEPTYTEPSAQYVSMSGEESGKAECISETFKKTVKDPESNIIGAITTDNRIVLYHGYANPTLSEKLEVITNESQKYQLNMDTIDNLDSIIDTISMRDHLYKMCKLLAKYDENRIQLKRELVAILTSGVG